ncbi:hypothetical protein MMUC44124_29185 [Mycolicibacterium mucogenicum DSM 44124]|nr:hypothetical protein MMUC44124_29185 [Mycolicibacterium mucogenicum DSM 44124]
MVMIVQLKIAPGLWTIVVVIRGKHIQSHAVLE